MKRILTALILCSSIVGYAQEDHSLKYAETINKDDLYGYLSIIASDALEGRETGERGQKMAAAFLEYQFAELGLKPIVDNNGKKSYIQPVPLEKSVPGETYLKVGDVKLENFDKLIYWGSKNIEEEKKFTAVFAGKGEEADYGNVSIKNEAVLIFPGEGFQNWRTKADLARKNGATEVIMAIGENEASFSAMVGRFKRFLSGGSLGLKSEDEATGGIMLVSPRSAADIMGTELEDLQKAMESGRLKKIAKAEFAFKAEREVTTIMSENVLGFLEGGDRKDEYIVITAHYDHIGRNGDAINNGADDDGSGTTAILELAQAFIKAKAEGNGPRRSILFMTVTGEEKGLLGSEYYVKNPVLPLEKTVVNLNIDMIGRVDEKHTDNPDYVYLVGSDRLSTELHQISEKINETYSQLTLDYTYNDEAHPDRIYYRSDHWNFAKNNIPIIFYFNGTHEDYHRPTDTIDKINFEQLVNRTKLVFHTAWVVANRDDRLVVDKIQDQQLNNRN